VAALVIPGPAGEPGSVLLGDGLSTGEDGCGLIGAGGGVNVMAVGRSGMAVGRRMPVVGINIDVGVGITEATGCSVEF